MTENSATLPSLDLITKYITALQQRDHDELSKLRSDEFVLDWVHGDAFADQPLAREAVNQFWQSWFLAFSEMDFEVTRTIAAEKVVVSQWIFTGTHSHDLAAPVFDPPLSPTGKTIRLRGISVYDIEDGLIQKESMYIDLATLYVELGVTE